MLAVFLSVVLVCLTTGIHHEAMQLASRIPKLELKHPRYAALLVVLLMTLAHVVEILVWGIAFYLIRDQLTLIAVTSGEKVESFLTFFYFSAETYTSLGFGDLVPMGDLRLLIGVETLNGLLMIGWSASFLYLVMTRVWKLGDGADEGQQGARRASLCANVENARSDREVPLPPDAG